MINKLWWKTLGKGGLHLVLLHGWGLNAEVWSSISKELSAYFTLHLVDLPGFGRSQSFGAMCVEEMAEQVLESAPDKAIWVGWSFGGLVASQIALMRPKDVLALVTVASSPCFSAKKNWPGIKLKMLSDFQNQLSEDFQRTIERFLSLQTLGTETVRRDMRTLGKVMSIFQVLDIEVLNSGLEILKRVDFRKSLANLSLPHLRIYGNLDSLVPCKVATILDAYWPKSESLIIKRAAHVPFISHQKEFCNAIISLSQRLR